jgi:uncharacterized membrane protein
MCIVGGSKYLNRSTSAHLNRVLRQLREQQLITLKADHVVIEDVKGLMKLASFDNAYVGSKAAISAFP